MATYIKHFSGRKCNLFILNFLEDPNLFSERPPPANNHFDGDVDESVGVTLQRWAHDQNRVVMMLQSAMQVQEYCSLLGFNDDEIEAQTLLARPKSKSSAGGAFRHYASTGALWMGSLKLNNNVKNHRSNRGLGGEPGGQRPIDVDIISPLNKVINRHLPVLGCGG